MVDTGEKCDLGGGDGGKNGTGVGCNDTCDSLGLVTTLAGSGASGSKDGIGLSAEFGQPVGVTLADGGTVLYVLDQTFVDLRAIDLPTAEVITLAGNHGGDADGDGLATSPDAGFYEPDAVILYDGGLLIADYGALRFFGFTATRDGGTLSTVAGHTAVAGVPFATFDAGAFDVCVYGAPLGMVEVEGLVYTNAFLDSVLAVSNLATKVLTGLVTLPPDTEQGGLTALNGVVYSALSADDDILSYDLATTAVAKVAPSLVDPQGLCTDYKQSIYVCDTGSGTIKQYNLATGRVSLLAGGGAEVPEADGLGAEAGFFVPAACVFDLLNGVMYVVDQSGNTVRKIE